jgi:hypothetical protein
VVLAVIAISGDNHWERGDVNVRLTGADGSRMSVGDRGHALDRVSKWVSERSDLVQDGISPTGQ